VNLNCALILFTVCRNIISLFRTSLLNKIVPFDENISFHIAIAWSITFWGTVHSIGHMYNFLYVANASNDQTTAEKLNLASGPGLTGQFIVVSLFLMITSAMASVRRKFFELFWYTHHLFIVFFGLLLVHGAFCFIKANPGVNPTCSGPSFWKWWLASALAYLIERILREVRGRRKTNISKVVQHPSKVVEVQIKKSSFAAKSGQYIFICCPEIAVYEWHPFTLTSSPEEDFLSIHIRVVGDWTNAFAKRLGCRFGDPDEEFMTPPESLPFVMVDGPYGSASEDVFDYATSVLIGAGIGVTPFASVLKSVWYRVNSPTNVMKLRKVYFFWICRDTDVCMLL